MDAGNQWVEEREASCQTEDMAVDSFSQTLDMVDMLTGQEKQEEQEFGRDEGVQTMLSESVTLALAILANRSAYHLHHAICSKPLLSRRITIPGCCTVSTPS